jgi:hypothetical protein
MPRLNFKRQFCQAVLGGQKTTTLRRWKRCALEAGDRVHSKGIGWLRIGSCEAVQLSKLSGKDARADGFASLRELFAVLKRIYPNQKGDGKKWYRVVFSLEKRAHRAPTENGQITAKKPAPKLGGEAKARLARRIQDELDKAVRRSRSLAPL